MKKYIVLILAALALLLSACGNGDGEIATPTADPQQSEIPSPTATPTPDFAGTDFSGSWYVFEIIDSNGMPVTEAEKQNLGAGFTLELLPNGTYFVYNQDSKVLGQGTYSVSLNQLILTANGAETAYEITDADTLRIIQPDTSITVMKRVIDETTQGEDLEGDTSEDGGDIEGDTPEEDIQESGEDSTATPDPAATDGSIPSDSASTAPAEPAE